MRHKEKLLFEAINQKNAKRVTSLLDEGVNVNCRNANCQTPLHSAVLYEQVEIVTLLLQRGANSNTEDFDSKTPVHIANHPEYLNIVPTPLRREVKSDARRNLLCLFTYSSMECALFINNIEIIQLLLEHGADVNSKNNINNTPLHSAVSNNVDVVTLLIKNGAKINYQNKRGFTPLHLAALDGTVDVVKCLINNGADVNIPCHSSWLPLHYALIAEKLDSAVCLLENGTNFEYRLYGGDTFLHVAVYHKLEESVKLLLDYDADTNAVNDDGITPLQLSIQIGTNRMTYFLLFHIIKLRSLGVFANQKNVNCLEEKMNDELKRGIAKCEREVERLKQRKIANTNVSLYKILTKNLKEAMLYLRNEDVKRELSMINFDAEFPLYSRMINQRFALSSKRLDLFYKGYDLISSILLNVHVLPITCIDKIVSYFNAEDLEFLINSFNKFKI